MQNRELQLRLQRIEGLIERTQAATGQSLELQSHWGRYLCVLVAGFLESAIEEVYGEYAQKATGPRPARFVSRAVARVQNPKANKFVEVAREFDPEWADKLAEYMAEDGRKEAVDGIMNNRHQIAHGRDAGITVAKVASYLGKCVEVVEFIEDQCSGSMLVVSR